jgi:hypothetical protein
LCSPQDTSAKTQEGTGENIEPVHIGVQGNEQANRVETVSDTANGDGNPNTNPIDNGACHEANDGEDGVEGRVLQESKVRLT